MCCCARFEKVVVGRRSHRLQRVRMLCWLGIRAVPRLSYSPGSHPPISLCLSNSVRSPRILARSVPGKDFSYSPAAFLSVQRFHLYHVSGLLYSPHPPHHQSPPHPPGPHSQSTDCAQSAADSSAAHRNRQPPSLAHCPHPLPGSPHAYYETKAPDPPLFVLISRRRESESARQRGWCCGSRDSASAGTVAAHSCVSWNAADRAGCASRSCCRWR